MTSAPVLNAVAIGKILIATDFSAASDKAMMYALPIADFFGASLYVLHVVTPPAPPPPSMEFERLPENIDQEDATEQFRILEKSSVLSRFQHWLLLERGEIMPAVQSTIRKHEIGLVVTGTHGHGGVAKMLLGSVAEEIFREVACPVLTVGPHVPEAEHWGFHRIMLATDFKDGSLHGLPYAISLAQGGADLILLHVLTSGGWMPSEAHRMIQEAEKRMQTLVPREVYPDREPQTVAEFGSPAEVIVRNAERLGAELIVMGVRATDSRRAATHLPWSVAHQVVHDAHCPVLTVRG